jgi:cell division protein FtsZ
MSLAQEGINQMVEEVDSLITIPNQKLLEVLGKGCTMVDGFKAANDVLAGAVRGISDIIMKPGMINVDFADVKTVMSEKGTAMMGTGSASGPNRAMEAAEQAMGSKLLEDIDLKDAKGILLNITAGENLTIEEFETVGNCVQEYASEEAIIVPGTVIDETSGDTLTVTVVATGLASKKEKQNATTNNKINFLETKRELPLSSASKQIIENPPNIEMLKQLKGNQSKGLEEELLDIPSFMRSQID